jgi:hypothetical protein
MESMVKCPFCGYEEGHEKKEWEYGPKRRKGPWFTVKLYECSNCHRRFREYIVKETGRVIVTTGLKKTK